MLWRARIARLVARFLSIQLWQERSCIPAFLHPEGCRHTTVSCGALILRHHTLLPRAFRPRLSPPCSFGYLLHRDGARKRRTFFSRSLARRPVWLCTCLSCRSAAARSCCAAARSVLAPCSSASRFCSFSLIQNIRSHINQTGFVCK